MKDMSAYKDVFKHWGLNRVINASGTMTSIGASKVKPEALDAIISVMPEFVSMEQLQERASTVISGIIGTEAGCITACSASAITTGVAAAITGLDLDAIEQIPNCEGHENRVVVPMGHMINYGAPIHQAIALAGAEVIPVGTAAMCEIYHLEAALREGAAAAVYVVSHHTVREGELPMELFVEICHNYDVPVIIDMASEYDMDEPVKLGADLIIYSGHKFMCGPTSGIVAGKRDLVRATYLQNRGIGRVMKMGKEAVVGALAALEIWAAHDFEADRASEEKNLAFWLEILSGVEGLTLARHTDWTGNPITRIEVQVDPSKAGLYAWELSDRLACRETRIMVRDGHIEEGLFHLDPCNVNLEEVELVATAISDEIDKAKDSGDGCKSSWSDVKRARSTGPLNFLGDN